MQKKFTARVVAKKYSQKQVAAELASLLSAQTVLALLLFSQIFFYTLLWLLRNYWRPSGMSDKRNGITRSHSKARNSQRRRYENGEGVRMKGEDVFERKLGAD